MRKPYVTLIGLALVGVLLTLSVAVVLAVNDDGLFELGDGAASPGTADILGDSDPSNGPDWAELFNGDGTLRGSDGNGIPLLQSQADGGYGGLTARFLKDDISTKINPDQTTFLSRNKNSDPISSWGWGPGGVASKGELSNFYVYATASSAGGLVIYAGLERVDPGGDSHVDIELNQSLVEPLACSSAPCSFSGQRSPNDVLLVMDYTKGGALGVIEVRVWNGSEWTSQQTLNREGCIAGDSVCGFNNANSIPGGDWPSYLVTRNEAIVTDNLEPNAFTELGVNVTQLLGTTPCFQTVQAKTRSSSSFDSTLLDFAMTSIDLCKTKVSIEPLTAANQIEQPHTLTAKVEALPSSNGFEWGPVNNASVVLAASGVGSLSSNSCVTGAAGTCTAVLTSTTTGLSSVSATATTPGSGLVQTTDGAGDNSAPAVKRWVDARLKLAQGAAADQVGNDHLVTATLEFDYGDGLGFVTAPAGQTQSIAFNNSGVGSLGSNTCATGANPCTVTLQSSQTGTSTLSADWSGTVQTGEGTASASASVEQPLINLWVDALLSLEADAGAGQIGEPVTITATLEFDYGDGAGPVGSTDAQTQTITFTIEDGPGSFNGNGQQATCTTGPDGICTVTFSSDTAGTSIISANWQGDISTEQIIILGFDKFTITQYSVDARLTLQPGAGASQVGNNYLITALLEFDYGAGFVAAPATEAQFITFNNSGVGLLSSNACANGVANPCVITLQSITQTGVSTVSAEWAGSIPVTTSDGTQLSGTASATDTAVSRWVDATLDIDPAVAARQARNPHVIAASLKLDYGDGLGLRPISSTQPISFALVGSGYFGSELQTLGPDSCTPDENGSCTVTLQSTQTGTSTVSASWSADIDTGEGPVSVSASAEPAANRWVDVRLAVSNAASTCDDAYLSNEAVFEPNDFVAEAYGPLNIAQSYNACVTATEEFDVYSFQVDSPSLLTVNLTGLQNDLDVAIFKLLDTPTEEFDDYSADVDATGRSSVGRSSVGRSSVGRSSVGRSSVGRSSVGRSSVGRSSVGRSSVALLGGGFSPGAVDEQAMGVAAEAGTYYVLVYRYPDAIGAGQYSLQIDAELIDTAQCQWSPQYGVGSPGAVYDGSGNNPPRTLILTHQGRLEATYGVAETSQLMSKLQQLAGEDSVRGIVVPVETDGLVSTKYGVWNGSYCSVEAANDVAAEIRRLAQDYLNNNPSIEYIVLAGSDEIIPFYRVPDEVQIANEQDYALASGTDLLSPSFWALAQGYILTQDYYVDADPLLWRGRQLYIPDKAIGRLVETPGQMMNIINNYLDPVTRGTTNVSSCLATGYEFLTDGTQAIQNSLESFGASVTTLNHDFWTAADLTEVWPLAEPRPDLVSVNAHFEHWNAIPAAGSALFTNSGITGSDTFTNTIAYSMGCHAGLNVPDGSVDLLEADPGRVTIPDFPQAFAQQSAAAWVANTGYGYGETVTVADSEQLMLFFTQELGRYQSVSVGQALVEAKKRFVDDTGVGGFGVYEEKSMIEATLYGLPMHRVSVPNPDPLAGQTTQTQSGVAGDAIVNQGAPFPLAGLQGISVTVNLDPAQHVTDRGRYYDESEQVYVAHGLPLQPKQLVDLTGLANYLPQGVLLISADYSSQAMFDPVVSIPSPIDPLPEPHYSDSGWAQDIFWALNPLNPNQLTLAGGQYNVDGLVERLYDSVALEVYYSDQSSSRLLDIVDVSGTLEGTLVNFSVLVEARDPASLDPGAQRVLVTYNLPNGDGTGSWRSIDLESEDGSLWSMSVSLPAGTEYFVQVLTVDGQVGVDTNRGLYYKVGESETVKPFGTEHTFTVRLTIDYGDGLGFVTAPDGTVDFQLVLSGGNLVRETCNTQGTVGGECQVVVNPTGSEGTTVLTALEASWGGEVGVDVGGAGQLVVVPATVSANQDSAATEWWAGSISLFKNAQVSARTPNPEICFGLVRADGSTLVSTSAGQQCFTFSAAQADHLFRWEGLEAGTYLITETVPSAYAPLAASPDSVLFTDIVVDDSHQNWVMRTVQNVPANEGCTPGYWRNHLSQWGLDPNASFYATFDVSYSGTSPLPESLTLGQAVSLGGGGFEKLARHGTAALLSAQAGIYYPYTYSEVLGMIQSGLAGGAEPEATQLADANNLGCPLN
ncbi:MAG: hypothetical protein JSV81_11890 [Anaerolineales bacterium]|nr:MAG: hypothetical protein JSV81_11890 [Anaerolineales bacterium]